MNPFATENRFGGKPFAKLNRYKLKDGDNVYRILPAMGDLATEGRWSVYYNYVFGFKSTDGKHFPFESPEVYNHKEKRVEIPCAATTLIEGLKAQLQTAKNEGKTELVGQLTKLVGDYPIMGVYSLTGSHFMNVVDRQGNVGVLELGHKAKLALDNERNRIKNEEGFDILSVDNGRFVNIRRTGKNRDTAVQVTVLKEKIDVPGVGKVDRDVVHVVDDALRERLIARKNEKWVYKEAANLDNLYQKPSSTEVELIVKNADITTGKSVGVDALKKNKPISEESVVETASEQPTAAQTATVQTSVATPTATQTAQVAATAQNTAPTTVSSVVQKTKTDTKQAPATTIATTQTTAEKVAAMSPDEFMKQMGINL